MKSRSPPQPSATESDRVREDELFDECKRNEFESQMIIDKTAEGDWLLLDDWRLRLFVKRQHSFWDRFFVRAKRLVFG